MTIIIHVSNSFQPISISNYHQQQQHATRQASSTLFSSSTEFDFDVAIIGCGVGGHGAALHSRGQQLNTAVFAGGDVGGTCVNRGCVPSKALLAASGRVRDMQNINHLESMGITVSDPNAITFSREGIANHAKNLANKVKSNLEGSLIGLGVTVIEGRGVLTGKPNEIKDDKTGKIYKAKVSTNNKIIIIKSNGRCRVLYVDVVINLLLALLEIQSFGFIILLFFFLIIIIAF